MNRGQVSLVTVIDEFLCKGFSFDEGYTLLGAARKESEGAIMVDPPPGSNIEWAALEKLKGDPYAPPFLAGLSVRFEKPVAVAWEALRKRFGPEGCVPRFRRGDDTHYLFHLKGKDFDGNLILDVPGDTASSRRPVKSQFLRRCPLGQE